MKGKTAKEPLKRICVNIYRKNYNDLNQDAFRRTADRKERWYASDILREIIENYYGGNNNA